MFPVALDRKLSGFVQAEGDFGGRYRHGNCCLLGSNVYPTQIVSGSNLDHDAARKAENRHRRHGIVVHEHGLSVDRQAEISRPSRRIRSRVGDELLGKKGITSY